MTYDELLAKLNPVVTVANITKQYNSIRAVVELLKDYSDGQVRVNEEFNQGILALSNVIKEAIEKELG